MIRRAIIVLLCMAGLLLPVLSQGSDMTLETSHLILSDATGNLSNENLTRLAGQAQETLDKILAFWSADPGTARFGKIRVVFDAPRRDFYSSVFYWDKQGEQRIRIVQVFGTDG